MFFFFVFEMKHESIKTPVNHIHSKMNTPHHIVNIYTLTCQNKSLYQRRQFVHGLALREKNILWHLQTKKNKTVIKLS